MVCMCVCHTLVVLVVLVIVTISLNLLTKSLLDGWLGNSNDAFCLHFT